MQMSDRSLTTIDATTQMRLSHITFPFFGLPSVSPTLLTIFTTLEGTSAMLEGTSTQLLTTSGDAHRTIRAFVSSETRIRTVRYVHPRRPIRASNDGHHAAEPAHNQCLADR